VPVVAGGDPRKWIPAIVGGVILGQALWSLLQLLIRDWLVPAVLNLLGQGPTQNQSAFLPQPLLVAFVEACLAGILLILLMAWSGRRSGTVVVRVQPQSAVGPAVTSIAAVPRTPSVPSSPAPATLTPVAVTPRVEARPAASISKLASPSEETAETPAWKPAFEPAPAAQRPPTPAPEPAAVPAAVPPKRKKPKTVYYNSVGEPIESDD
jgi:hypothetical protein